MASLLTVKAAARSLFRTVSSIICSHKVSIQVMLALVFMESEKSYEAGSMLSLYTLHVRTTAKLYNSEL